MRHSAAATSRPFSNALQRMSSGIRTRQGTGFPSTEPGVGKAHVERFFAALRGIEFLKFEPTDFLTGGNQVAVPIAVEVRVKETGKVVKALEIHLETFDQNGKVKRFFHRIDRHAFVVAYGL